MTDDFSTELDEIAKIVARSPSGLAELREMIASLPAPSPLTLPGTTDTRLPSTEEQTQQLSSGPVSAAGVADTSTASPASISGGAIIPGTLQAAAFASSIRPIQQIDGPSLPTLPDANFPVGAVIFNQDDGRIYRNDADVWHTLTPEVGMGNGLADPTFESIWDYDITTSEATNGLWKTQMTVVSGTPPSDNPFLGDLYQRSEVGNHPFNSAILEMYSPYYTTAAHDTESALWPITAHGTWASDLPFVVAAIQVIDWGCNSGVLESDFPEVEITLELWSRILYGTPTLRASTTVDVKTLPADYPAQIWVSHVNDADFFYPRLVFHVKKNATAANGGWGIGLGEPQIALTSTPDVPAFSPAIAAWVPSAVAGIGNKFSLSSKSNAGYTMFSTSNAGYTTWGGGTADADLRLRRSAAKEMTIDDNAGGAATIKIVGALQVNGVAVDLGNEALAYIYF